VARAGGTIWRGVTHRSAGGCNPPERHIQLRVAPRRGSYVAQSAPDWIGAHTPIRFAPSGLFGSKAFGSALDWIAAHAVIRIAPSGLFKGSLSAPDWIGSIAHPVCVLRTVLYWR